MWRRTRREASTAIALPDIIAVPFSSLCPSPRCAVTRAIITDFSERPRTFLAPRPQRPCGIRFTRSLGSPIDARVHCFAPTRARTRSRTTGCLLVCVYVFVHTYVTRLGLAFPPCSALYRHIKMLVQPARVLRTCGRAHVCVCVFSMW